MKFDFDLQLNKKDVITIVVLCIVFFSIAVANLGYTSYPSTVTQVTSGQSFYVDLGSQTNVKSMLFLLDLGAMNVTISSGAPGNWTVVTNSIQPVLSSDGSWSEDYNKWYEIPIDQYTQFLKVDIGYVGESDGTQLSQIAVINQTNQQVTIQTINNIGTENLPVNNLINAQNTVHYPIDYMENTYFDEIYFVRTAQQYTHLQEGQLPYEWTHPPLGKLIQASGLLIFGFDPFGWRIMGVIFATLMIPLIYLLGKKMFGTWIGGFSAAFLLTFDFMHFTMGRMGTADTYLVCFSLASQLFFFIYLKNVVDKGWKTNIFPLFLAFVFFALALSSKFAIAIYGGVGELAILVVLRLIQVKNLKSSFKEKFYAFFDQPYAFIVVFILMVIGIYFLTYIPDMLMGRSFLDVIKLQNSMYIYHSTLTATHPFSSPWYTWPLMFDPLNKFIPYASSTSPYDVHVPLYLESATINDNLRSTIALLGNPAVWWIGFSAILGVTVYSVSKVFSKTFSLKKYLPAIFLVVVFFFQWLPYIFISRVVFIYHFYSDVPILCLASAFVINRYWNHKWMKIAAAAYFALTIALFVLFYPVISGVPASPATINSLKWFNSWVF